MVVPAVAVLIVAGLHVPVIPLVDVVGSVPGVDPTQYGPKAVNVGVTFVFTVTVTDAHEDEKVPQLLLYVLA